MREILSALRLGQFLNDENYSSFISFLNGKEGILEFIGYYHRQWGPNGLIKREFLRYFERDYDKEIIANRGAEDYNDQIDFVMFQSF